MPPFPQDATPPIGQPTMERYYRQIAAVLLVEPQSRFPRVYIGGLEVDAT